MSADQETEDLAPRPLFGGTVTALPSCRIPARHPLTGRFVILEPLDPARHSDALYEASHSSEEALKIWDYLPYGPWDSKAAFHDVMRNNCAQFDFVYYAIRDLSADRILGHCSYMDMHPQNGVIEIGYIWFAPALQRTRAATEAMYLLLAHAFDDLQYRRMQWRCNALNQKSRQAARRLGFGFEGIFHNHMIFKGKNRDTAWYSILDTEWPETRERLQNWLDDSNFDAAGQAKSSLAATMASRRSARRG